MARANVSSSDNVTGSSPSPLSPELPPSPLRKLPGLGAPDAVALGLPVEPLPDPLQGPSPISIRKNNNVNWSSSQINQIADLGEEEPSYFHNQIEC